MGESVGPPNIDPGSAGGSARRQHELRKAGRERRVREKHPVLGNAILAITPEPNHERAWEFGAEGEERVGRWLAKHAKSEVIVLHDRRIRGRRTNIDHLIVAPTGVWVIDSKRYRGRVAVVKPLFGQPNVERRVRSGSG